MTCFAPTEKLWFHLYYKDLVFFGRDRQKKIFPSVASEGRGRNLDESPAKIVAHMLRWFPIFEGREGRRWDDEEGGTSDE